MTVEFDIKEQATKHWPLVITGCIVLLILIGRWGGSWNTADNGLCKDVNINKVIGGMVQGKINAILLRENVIGFAGNKILKGFGYSPVDAQEKASFSLNHQAFSQKDGIVVRCVADIVYDNWLEDSKGSKKAENSKDINITYALTPNQDNTVQVQVYGLENLE